MLIAFSEQVIVYFIFKIYPEGSFIVLIDVGYVSIQFSTTCVYYWKEDFIFSSL